MTPDRPRILFFTSMPSVLTEEIATLDVLWSEHERGADTFYLACRRSLLVCPTNPFHAPEICDSCIRQSEHSLSHLLPRTTRVLELPPPPLIDAPVEFRSMVDVLDYRVDGARLGHLLISSLLDETRDVHHDLAPSELERLGVMAANASHLFRRAREIIGLNEITRVVVRNPRRDSDGPVVAAARSLGVGTAVVGPAGTPDALRVFYAIDTEFLHDDARRARIRAVPAPRPTHDDAVSIPGLEYLTALAAGLPPKGVKANRVFPTLEPWSPGSRRPELPLLAVFPSSQWEAFASLAVREGLTPDGRLRTDQYDLLLDLVTSPVIRDLCDVVIRWHPNLRFAGPNEQARILEVVERSHENIENILPDSPSSSRSILEQCGLALTFGSSIAVDAIWAGVPVFQFGHGPLDESDAVHAIGSIDELSEALRAGPPPVDRDEALRLAFVMQNLDLPTPRFFHLSESGWRLSSSDAHVKAPEARGSRFSRLRSRLRPSADPLR